MVETEPDPWYREFNSVFWLTLSASVFAFFGLCLQAILKSRCKTCKMCGIEIERDVAPPGREPHIDLSILERARTSSIDVVSNSASRTESPQHIEK